MLDLAKRIKEISELRGKFTLKSGKVSDVYFDKYKFESDPELLREIADKMKALIPSDTAVLAGLEMGGIPIVTALSQTTGIPAAFVRKEAKKYGTRKRAEGADLSAGKIVLVEDVVSTGGALLDASRWMREEGFEAGLAICVIDRQTGGAENLGKEGIKLLSLFTRKDISGE